MQVYQRANLIFIACSKRQNLYYIKVQERVSTLDADCDYIMTVTTITGPAQTSEDVAIHNKYYKEETEPLSITESLPMLETVERKCRSPSVNSATSGFDERSLDIDSILDTSIRYCTEM